jgi:hypothetical protein
MADEKRIPELLASLDGTGPFMTTGSANSIGCLTRRVERLSGLLEQTFDISVWAENCPRHKITTSVVGGSIRHLQQKPFNFTGLQCFDTERTTRIIDKKSD